MGLYFVDSRVPMPNGYCNCIAIGLLGKMFFFVLPNTGRKDCKPLTINSHFYYRQPNTNHVQHPSQLRSRSGGRSARRTIRSRMNFNMLPVLANTLPSCEIMDGSKVEQVDNTSMHILENIEVIFRDPIALQDSVFQFENEPERMKMWSRVV